MELLRLSALDADDLKVISAHMQDAVLVGGDVAFLPRQKRLALVANRFDWAEASEGARRRRRVGLRIDRVLRASMQNFDPAAKDKVYSLLAILFHPEEPAPSGAIELVFSGEAALRLQVECIEMALEDLGPAWDTRRTPSHSEG